MTNPPSGVRRFAERFALVAFGLYHLPLFVNNYPSVGGGGFNNDGLAIKWGHVFTAPGIWVARHLFHVTGAMNGADAGDNGDVAEEYGRLLIAVVIAAVGALVWTLNDRRLARGAWVSESLRVLLRYSIALGITSYGIAKVLPMQFPPVSAFTLEQRVGELTPMALLWTFMEFSRPYAFLAGVLEMIAVFLLCVRQTATLGAIVCLVVMVNVAFMNYAYGVPVKLYATMIVLSALVLIAYDAPRLLGVFVQNRPVESASTASVFHERITARWRWAGKVVLVGSVIMSSVVAMNSAIAERGTSSPFDGAWVVTSFVRDGVAGTDSLSWRKIIVQQNAMLVQFASDARMFCRQKPSADIMTLALSCANARQGTIRFSREGELLRLDGTFDGAPVSVLARPRTRADYPLLKSRFRWMPD